MLKVGLFLAAVKELLTSPKFIVISIAIIALFIVPLTLIEIHNQQSLQQNAETILWMTTQSASTVCAPNGGGANITATFINTEQKSSSTAMDVTVKDNQTGKTASMGTIQGGQSKTVTIATGKTSLAAGSVTFTLKWADGHSGTDTRTANYGAISKCINYIPTPYPTVHPTPTYKPTPTPTVPPGKPTPTICPTLGPVKNVHIDCPNCKLNPSPSPNPSP